MSDGFLNGNKIPVISIGVIAAIVSMVFSAEARYNQKHEVEIVEEKVLSIDGTLHKGFIDVKIIMYELEIESLYQRRAHTTENQELQRIDSTIETFKQRIKILEGQRNG